MPPLEDVNPDLVEPDPAPRREFVTGELPYRHRVAPSESDSDLSDDDVPNLVENLGLLGRRPPEPRTLLLGRGEDVRALGRAGFAGDDALVDQLAAFGLDADDDFHALGLGAWMTPWKPPPTRRPRRGLDGRRDDLEPPRDLRAAAAATDAVAEDRWFEVARDADERGRGRWHADADAERMRLERDAVDRAPQDATRLLLDRGADVDRDATLWVDRWMGSVDATTPASADDEAAAAAATTTRRGLVGSLMMLPPPRPRPMSRLTMSADDVDVFEASDDTPDDDETAPFVADGVADDDHRDAGEPRAIIINLRPYKTPEQCKFARKSDYFKKKPTPPLPVTLPPSRGYARMPHVDRTAPDAHGPEAWAEPL